MFGVVEHTIAKILLFGWHKYIYLTAFIKLLLTCFFKIVVVVHFVVCSLCCPALPSGRPVIELSSFNSIFLTSSHFVTFIGPPTKCISETC